LSLEKSTDWISVAALLIWNFSRINPQILANPACGIFLDLGVTRHGGNCTVLIAPNCIFTAIPYFFAAMIGQKPFEVAELHLISGISKPTTSQFFSSPDSSR